jgi:hypothetical protein
MCLKYILANVSKVSTTKMKTGPGAHPDYYTMGTSSLLAVQQLGKGINHPPPSSNEREKKTREAIPLIHL